VPPAIFCNFLQSAKTFLPSADLKTRRWLVEHGGFIFWYCATSSFVKVG
jgi:hypothetical protein